FLSLIYLFFSYRVDKHRALYSFPTRRSSDLSARFPADTNVDSPNPRDSASARIVVPNAPDWQKNPVCPAAGNRGARVAFNRTSRDRKSTRLNSSHVSISYAVFCLKKKITRNT